MQANRFEFDDPIDRAVAGVVPHCEAADAVEQGALRNDLVTLDQVDDALRAEWRDLGEASDDPNPYFAQWFLEPAMRHLDPEGEVKLCLLRRAEDGLLVALAPIVFQKGYAKLPLKHACIWTHRHCFNGAPLIREGYPVAAYAALFDWIDTRPNGSCFFRFAMMPFDHGTHEALSEACAMRERGFRVQTFCKRAILTKDNDFDELMKAAMSGKKRKELRRLANRFGDLGAADFTDLPIDNDAISAFLDLENAGWKQSDPDGFPLAQSVGESRFFREAMMEGAEAGAVTCTALTLDGAPKAMLFSLAMGDHLSAFKTTYDESLSSYSPGVRLIIEATQRMLDSDARVLDSCAKPDHSVVDGLWPERLPIAQINVPASRAADKTLLRTAATIEAFKNTALKRWIKK